MPPRNARLPTSHDLDALRIHGVASLAGVMLSYASAGTQAVRLLPQRSLTAMNRGCAAGMWLLAATLAFWRRP